MPRQHNQILNRRRRRQPLERGELVRRPNVRIPLRCLEPLVAHHFLAQALALAELGQDGGHRVSDRVKGHTTEPSVHEIRAVRCFRCPLRGELQPSTDRLHRFTAIAHNVRGKRMAFAGIFKNRL